MAIDKRKLSDLIKGVDELFGKIPFVNEEQKKWITEKILGEALADLRKLVQDSRPPVLMFIGRTGEGKSSVINALAGRPVAPVGKGIESTTHGFNQYDIVFQEQFAAWKVFDSRGIFELKPAKYAESRGAIDVLIDGIIKHQPDVLLHVISSTNVLNMAPDLEVIQQVKSTLEAQNRCYPPTILVINKIDTLGDHEDWPPSQFPQKASLISEQLDYIEKCLVKTKGTAIDGTGLLLGRLFDDSYTHIAVVPLEARERRKWNISTLSTVIGTHLPESAQLEFFQAQQRRDKLKELAHQITNRFATIAGGIGACPIPISDILILTPLQLGLVATIAGLSCRDFSIKVAIEFLASTGLVVVVANGFKWSAAQLAKFFGLPGDIIAGNIAFAGTKSIGQAAIAYYFASKPELEFGAGINDIFAEESVYLGHLGGYDNAGANSTNRDDHFGWAGGQTPGHLTENLAWKYCFQYDRQARISSETAHLFYGDLSARLASYGIDLGNPGANGLDAGSHAEWARHQSHETLRGQIADKVRRLMAGS